MLTWIFGIFLNFIYSPITNFSKIGSKSEIHFCGFFTQKTKCTLGGILDLKYPYSSLKNVVTVNQNFCTNPYGIHVYVNTFSGGWILMGWHHLRISFLFSAIDLESDSCRKNIFQTNVFFICVNYLYPLFLIICPNVWWWWFLNNVSLVSSKLGPKSTISGSRSRKSSSRIMIEPQPVMDRLCYVGL